MKATFPKSERLKSRKEIAELFSKGDSLFKYPIKWLAQKKRGLREPPVRACVLVSRKRWKRAADRNRIKRLLREVYRLNKSEIVSTLSTDEHLNLMLLYVADEELSFSEIETAFLHLIDQWINTQSH